MTKDEHITTECLTTDELNIEALDGVAAGLNPQPLPPREDSPARDAFDLI
jgi:hypothetical protein